MKLKNFYFIFFSTIILLSSCESNRWEADVSNIEADLNLKRFDLQLSELASKPFNEEGWSELQKEYPVFSRLYVEGIMQFGRSGETESIYTFNRFLNDKDINELLDEVKKQYPQGSLKDLEKKLTDAFKLYKYHFPNRTIPELRTFISAFTFSTVAADSLLGIGLDMYLGGDFELYPKIGIPQYKFKHFSKEYMHSDALKAWLMTEFETTGAKNLLEQMVEQGKILYLLNAFMSDTEDHIFMNYSKEELEWCESNEAEIWFHFIEMELLHTSDNNKIKKYLGDAPFVAGFPEGSPGRVGQWIGWQIVAAYMDKNKNVSLAQLMKTQNADLILQQSKYKPQR